MSLDAPPCRDQSLAAAEPLPGTAVEVQGGWLLLEVREGWTPRVEQQPLPAALRAALASAPGVRLQLVRQPERASGPLAVWAVPADPRNVGARFEVADVDAVSSLPWASTIASGWDGRDGTALTDPLWIVCTHGKRDRCCAKHGVALYRAMRAADPQADVWQTTHLGGHRFAATALWLPAMVQVGRLDPSDGPRWLEASRAGRLHDAGQVRGHTHLPRAAQAAWLRLLGDAAVPDAAVPPLERATADDGGATRVVFEGHREVRVERVTRLPMAASCGAAPSTPTGYEASA